MSKLKGFCHQKMFPKVLDGVLSLFIDDYAVSNLVLFLLKLIAKLTTFYGHLGPALFKMCY